MKHMSYPRVIALALLLLAAPAFAAELRTAAQDSAPKFVRHSDGAVSGISIDVMKAINRVDPTLRFVGDTKFMPLKRIENQLDNGELDVFFGFIKNKRRQSAFTYIDPPIYSVANVLVARRHDKVAIKRLEEIKTLGEDNVVLLVYGVAQAEQLRPLGIALDDRGSSLEQNLHKLVRGRGRFVFQSEPEIHAAIRQSPPEVAENVRVLPTRFNESGRYVAFAKHVPPETVAKVRKALAQLAESGELKRIFDKYVQ